MSQIIAVIGQRPQLAATWLEKGVDVFWRICGLRPSSELRVGLTSLACFPSLNGFTPPLIFPDGVAQKSWGASVGLFRLGREFGHSALLGYLRHLDARSDPSAFLKDSDGSFGILAGHESLPGLTVCTDRLGLLHLYFAKVDEAVLISTSSLVLGALCGADWDERALRQYFAYGNAFEQRTLFSGVSKLPPASTVVFDHTGMTRSMPYWRASDFCYDRVSSSGSASELAVALEQSTATLTNNFSNPLLDLTGGFDSRAVFGAATNARMSFTAVTNGQAEDPDVRVAKNLAEQFAVRHHHRLHSPLSGTQAWSLCVQALPLVDGEMDVLLYVRTLQAHLSHCQQFDVSVNGSMGEICKGQWWEAMMPNIGRRTNRSADCRVLARLRFACFDNPTNLLASRYSDSVEDDFTGIIERGAAEGIEDLPNTALVDLAYLNLRMQRWQGRFTSATLRIWPCWSPFGSGEVLQLALAAPPQTRIRHRLMRRLIECQNPKLARIPLAQGYPALPLRWNTFHRFGPLVTEVSGNAFRYAKRRLGIARASAAAPPGFLSELLATEEVREHLTPQKMLTRSLYEQSELTRVLSGQNFNLVGRILTVEMVARCVRNR